MSVLCPYERKFRIADQPEQLQHSSCYLTSRGDQYRTDTGQFPDEEAEEGKKLAVDKVQYHSKVDARLDSNRVSRLKDRDASDCQLTFELYDTLIKERPFHHGNEDS